MAWKRCLLGCAAGMLLSSAAVDAYNIKCGPLQLQLGAQLTFIYTDNVNQSSGDLGLPGIKQDFGFECGPVISGGLALPVRVGNNPEELLTMRVSTGFSYKYWLNGGQQVTFSAPAGFQLSLPLHLGAWLVTVGDSFTFKNEPLESLVAVGVTSSEEYANTVTINGTRRFGRVALSLSGSRNDKWSPANPSTEETVYSFAVTPSVFLQESFSVFWANSVGFIFPKDRTSRSDGINVSTMVGVSGVITPSISGSVGIGFVHSQFDPVNSGTSTNNAGSGTDGITANIGLSYTQPLRPNTTHNLQGFYSPGVTATMNNSNYQTTYGARYVISHRLGHGITLMPNIGWTHSQSEGGASAKQEYDLLSIGVSLSRTFTRHLNAMITYRHQERTSPQQGQGYQVNDLRISFNYSF